MKFILEENLFQDFSPVIGVIVVEGIDNKDSTEQIASLLRAQEAATKTQFAGEGTIGAHPFISIWRKIYKKFGSDSYRCSSEALIRRVSKGDSLPKINKLVDLYNLISLKYVIPVGGEDLDTMEGNLRLGKANGTESFIRIGGEENEPPLEGEVVYKDDKGVICRRWNWREADRTKLTEKTTKAIIVVDGLAEIGNKTVEDATNELAVLIHTHCGGSARVEILSNEKPEMVLL